MPNPFISDLILCVSFLVEGIGGRPGVFGWLIRTRLVDLEAVDEFLNLLLRD